MIICLISIFTNSNDHDEEIRYFTSVNAIIHLEQNPTKHKYDIYINLSIGERYMRSNINTPHSKIQFIFQLRRVKLVNQIKSIVSTAKTYITKCAGATNLNNNVIYYKFLPHTEIKLIIYDKNSIEP